jgi:hypothetical protein
MPTHGSFVLERMEPPEIRPSVCVRQCKGKGANADEVGLDAGTVMCNASAQSFLNLAFMYSNCERNHSKKSIGQILQSNENYTAQCTTTSVDCQRPISAFCCTGRERDRSKGVPGTTHALLSVTNVMHKLLCCHVTHSRYTAATKQIQKQNFPACILPVLALGVQAQNAGGQLKVDALAIPIEHTATVLSSATGTHVLTSWDPIASVCQALLAAACTADEPW